MGILLSGYLPDENRQGLSSLEAQLLAEPDREIIVIGRLVQHSLTEPRGPGSDERDVTLTLKWAALEAVVPADEESIRSMITSTAADRRRQDELHFGDQEPVVPGHAARQADHPATGAGKKRSRRGRGGLSSVPAT